MTVNDSITLKKKEKLWSVLMIRSLNPFCKMEKERIQTAVEGIRTDYSLIVAFSEMVFIFNHLDVESNFVKLYCYLYVN